MSSHDGPLKPTGQIQVEQSLGFGYPRLVQAAVFGPLHIVGPKNVTNIINSVAFFTYSNNIDYSQQGYPKMLDPNWTL